MENSIRLQNPFPPSFFNPREKQDEMPKRFVTIWFRHLKTDWQSIRDFHPIYPIAWHALKPFSEEELRALNGQQPSTPSFLHRATRKLSRMLKGNS